MEVSGELHTPAALPPTKECQVPIVQEAWWAPEVVWTLWRKEKSCPCQESNPSRGPVGTIPGRATLGRNFDVNTAGGAAREACRHVATQHLLRNREFIQAVIKNSVGGEEVQTGRTLN
jgi:hypothetical protein